RLSALHFTATTALYTLSLHTLFRSNELEDILSYSVREICRIAGFARAALFWYTPITRSLDGIYSHNIDLDVIRRIRELDYNIPRWEEHTSELQSRENLV